MQYVILVYESAEDLARREQPERWAPLQAAYATYTRALREAGVLRGGEALEVPSIATVVSLRGGKVIVQDGPYADTKEQLGGIFVIDVPDLDAALRWAARCPAAETGKVEIRPALAPAAPGPPPAT